MRGIRLVLKTFWSPGAAFREIAESGIRPWAPILFQACVGVAVTLAFTLSVDLEGVLEAAQQSGQELTEEQQEELSALVNSPVLRVLGLAWAIGSGAASPVVVLAAVSGIYFAIFLLLGTTAGYWRFFALTAFAFMPTVISGAVNLLTMLLTRASPLDPTLYTGVSPAVFITTEAGEGATPLFTVAQSFSLVAIWVLLLLGIAYRTLLPKRVSGFAVGVAIVIPWLVFVAARVGFSALIR